MRPTIIIKLYAVIGLFSCSGPSRLEYALSFAGENRKELEKVLAYYKTDTRDSLKYRAACFLIENMPYHYYYDEEILSHFVADLCSLKQQIPDVTLGKDRVDPGVTDYLRNKYGNSFFLHLPLKNDAQTISADFLIDNIEMAFKVWEEQPFGKNIPFAVFCREILPYRVGNEPLREWRRTFYETFQPVLDAAYQGEDPLRACQVIYDVLVSQPWTFISELDAPHLGGKVLLRERMGNCREYADIMTYAMRALGIAGGTDIILQNPDHCYTKHYWNYTRDSSGSLKEFELYAIRPDVDSKNTERKRAKIYRPCFDIDPEHVTFLYPDKQIYPSLTNPLLQDVSYEYLPDRSFSLNPEHTDSKDEPVYLCVFNNAGWVPVAWSPVTGGHVTFHYVEPDIYYTVALYRDKKITLLTDPFRMKETGEVIYATPDTLHTETVHLTRKFRMKPHLEGIGKMAVGGKFQGANYPDFRDAVTFYTIEEEPGLKYYDIPVTCPGRYRYVRYLSPDYKHCGIAELEFYNSGGKNLTGKIIGYEGEENGIPLELQDVFFAFDKDVLTFFYSRGETDIWAGLDLGMPEAIAGIRFLVWNDDNFIRENELYELFYFTKEKGAVSLGQQSGNKDQVLIYEHVPQNALLWLHNHSGGKEERIFSYQDGKHIWW